MKKKIIILIIIAVLIVALIIGLNAIKSNNASSNNVSEEKNPEYILTLHESHGGRGIAGQDLGSGESTEEFYISENDVFAESPFGGEWVLNTELDESNYFSYKKILRIAKLNDDNAIIEYKDKEEIINFGEEVAIPSNVFVADGINYSYTITISKTK